jgi:tetratricopeptide (TPR) repeat protein
MLANRAHITVALTIGLVAANCINPPTGVEIPAPVAADLALLDRAAAARVGSGADWSTLVAARSDTIDTSLRWYIRAGRVSDALRFANEMSAFWRRQGRIDAGRRLVAATLALPDSTPQHRARATAWYNAGVFAFRQRDQDAARHANEESLRLATEVADTTAIARALVGLSRVELRAGEYDLVRSHAAHASELLRAAGDTSGAIEPSHMVAAVNRMTGRDSDASTLYEQTLGLFRTQSDEPGIAMELMNLGYVRLHQGRRAEASTLFRDGLQRYEGLRDETSEEFTIAAFAALAADAGDATKAAMLFGAARKLLAGSGITLDPDDQYEMDRYSAKARQQLGDTAYARALAAGEALTLADAIRLAKSM